MADLTRHTSVKDRSVLAALREFGFRSFWTRIFWSVIPIVLILGIAQGAILIREHRQLVTDEFIKRGLSMAENLAYISELGVFAEDDDLLRASIRGVVQNPNVSYVLIYNSEGKVLAQGGADIARLPAAVHELRPQRDSVTGSGAETRLLEIAGVRGEIVQFFMPIVAAAGTSAQEQIVGQLLPGQTSAMQRSIETIGYIRLGLSLREVESQLVRLLQLWAGITVVLLLISTLAIYFVSRRATQPIKRLTEKAQLIAGGILDQKIDVESRDEVGELATKFNQMAAALKANTDQKENALDRLGELNRTLEQRVAERTASLEQQRTALERSLKELEAMEEISRALGSRLEMRHVLETIIRNAMALSNSDAGGIAKYEEYRRSFRFIQASGDVASKFLDAVAKMRVNHEKMKFDRLTQITKLKRAKGFPYRDIAIEAGFNSVIMVPLQTEDARRFIVLFRRSEGQYAPRIVSLLTALASNSSIAFNNARLFEEIEQQKSELEEISKHKSQFLANMSHELRTPMNAILGYTELILDNVYGPISEKVRSILDRVDTNGRHLLALINDVLDISKIEAGQLTLSLNPYEPNRIIQEVAASVEGLALDKGLKLEIRCAEDLPMGVGDERRIGQVLINLIGNAIKFTEAGKVVVTAIAAGDMYHFSVADTGPGIPSADLNSIFEEFHQIDTSSTREKGGTGLGLAISQRIVEMHGGTIWVDSVVGEGANFQFTLPISLQTGVSLK